MDGTRFDQLIKRLSTQQVSRLTALRGLAAGAVAGLTGLSLFAEDGEAKKDGKKTRKRRICHRTSATDPGVNKKLKAKRAKRHLRNHQFDTKGRCAAAPAPPRVGCAVNTDCAPGQVCQNAICVTPGAPNPGTLCGNDQDCAGGLVCRGGRCDLCNNNNECPGDQMCLDGQCRGGENDFRFGLGGEDCEDFSGQACPHPLACLPAFEISGSPDLCLLPGQQMGQCYPRSDNECATDCDTFCGESDVNNVNPTCVLGACVVPGDSDACDACDGDNVSGICMNLQENPQCDSNYGPRPPHLAFKTRPAPEERRPRRVSAPGSAFGARPPTAACAAPFVCLAQSTVVLNPAKPQTMKPCLSIGNSPRFSVIRSMRYQLRDAATAVRRRTSTATSAAVRR
jgi:hypothetical protein